MQLVVGSCNICTPEYSLLGLLDPITAEFKVLHLPDRLAVWNLDAQHVSRKEQTGDGAKAGNAS